jgi:hypothetical protein
MSLNAATHRFLIDEPLSSPDTEAAGLSYPRPLSRLQGRGRDYQSMLTFAPISRPVTRRVLPPEEKEVQFEAPRRGLLGSLLALLRGAAPAKKQLRLAETVALGEKRFVAIIHAEGHKYLVGGGSSGVALLTRLDDATKSIDKLPQFQEVIEAAG